MMTLSEGVVLARMGAEELREEIRRLAKSCTDTVEPAYGEGREGF
jgi:hypothetical protein